MTISCRVECAGRIDAAAIGSIGRAGPANLQARGIAQPYEKEFFRKDGTRVSVLVGAAVYDNTQNEGVAFVVDLNESKEAEEAARAMRAALPRNSIEITHATESPPSPQLGASTAHEISQPLWASSPMPAPAFECWTPTPRIWRVHANGRRTLRDGNRASDVIARLRALSARSCDAGPWT